MDIAALSKEFPRDAVHWRAQSMTRDGTKAMALAYIDARDVMDRLDEVCGPANWQSKFTETAKGRVICSIGIKVGDEWVWKSDGAGDTAVEGEKGGVSDALKRAAVQWGVGRYLYRLSTPWVPCETYQNGQGKAVWKGWKQSPWDFVSAPKGQAPDRTPQPEPTSVELRDKMKGALENVSTLNTLDVIWQSPKFKADFGKLITPHQHEITAVYTDRKAALS